MVALFLRSELKSDRWAGDVRNALSECSLPVSLLKDADTSDAVANLQRAKVLGRFRGYREDRELFSDYPEKVTWQWVLLERDDFRRLKYIEYSYWNELTGGSRRPYDAVSTILEGRKVFGVSNQPAIEGADVVRSGATFDPIILVAIDATSDLVILEGHSRATAYALAGQEIPIETHALLGISPDFATWL